MEESKSDHHNQDKGGIENDRIHFLTWLTSNVCEDANSFVVKDELWARYKSICQDKGKTPISVTEGGKILCRTYTVKTVKRTIEKKEKRVFKGIQWKTCSEHNVPISLSAILSVQPDEFILTGKDLQSATFSLLAGSTINGNPVLKVVKIDVSGMWDLTVLGKLIQPNVIGAPNKIESTRDFTALMKAVKSSRVCEGFPEKNVAKQSRNGLTEKWQNGSDPPYFVRRSNTCEGVLGLTSTVRSCIKCRYNAQNYYKDSRPVETNVPDSDVVSTEECFDKMFPSAPHPMRCLLLAQRQCLLDKGRDPRGRRWEKDIITLCLSLWNRSPQNYTCLRNSGCLFLPSPSLLEKYKNVIQQRPGINHPNIRWMERNASLQNACMSGGVIFDEMSIQEDLFMRLKGDTAEYTGIVDTGSTTESMYLLTSGEKAPKIATHILQFVFLGYDGFRWPFAYYPTSGVTASALFNIFWDVVSALIQYGFKVDYVCMDGASANRSFIKLHEPVDYECRNIYTSCMLTFLMDYSHVIKRVRNNIASSGTGNKHTRLMMRDGKCIMWDHWIRAFHWDRRENPVRLHRQLTEEHLFLTKTSKMRNKLAEQVLNADMLQLMEQFQLYIGEEGDDLQSSVDLLRQTRNLVNIFRDGRPIREPGDCRLQEIQNVNRWFKNWEEQVRNSEDTASDQKKKLMTSETREDLNCLLVGFVKLCQRKTTEFPSQSILPASINSDIVENIFCQQRAIHHGANTNPNEAQYGTGLTSIILGQNMMSSKSNVGVTSTVATPYTIVCRDSLVSKRRSVETDQNSSPKTAKFN